MVFGSPAKPFVIFPFRCPNCFRSLARHQPGGGLFACRPFHCCRHPRPCGPGCDPLTRLSAPRSSGRSRYRHRCHSLSSTISRPLQITPCVFLRPVHDSGAPQFEPPMCGPLYLPKVPLAKFSFHFSISLSLPPLPKNDAPASPPAASRLLLRRALSVCLGYCLPDSGETRPSPKIPALSRRRHPPRRVPPRSRSRFVPAFRPILPEKQPPQPKCRPR